MQVTFENIEITRELGRFLRGYVDASGVAHKLDVWAEVLRLTFDRFGGTQRGTHVDTLANSSQSLSTTLNSSKLSARTWYATGTGGR